MGSTQCKSGKRAMRRKPTWAHKRWTVYDRVLGNMPRTNNFAESYNAKLNSFIEAKHPGFYTFVGKLKVGVRVKSWANDLLQSHVSTIHYKVDQLLAGRDVTKPRNWENEQRDFGIRAMLERYPTYTDKRKFLETMALFTSTTYKAWFGDIISFQWVHKLVCVSVSSE